MKRGPVTLGRLVLAGVALGNAPLALYALAAAFFAILHIAAGTMSQHLMPLSSLLAGALRAVLLGSAMGAASAAVFCSSAFAAPTPERYSVRSASTGLIAPARSAGTSAPAAAAATTTPAASAQVPPS